MFQNCTNFFLSVFVRLNLLLKKYENFTKLEILKIFLNNKTNLFLVICIAFTSIIAYPFLIPHLSHTSMSYHIAVHILSLDIAVFITTISFISFKKTKNKKLLLTSFSFVFLLGVEMMYLLQASGIIKIIYIPTIDIELTHILLLGMLGMFVWGVLKVDKRS